MWTLLKDSIYNLDYLHFEQAIINDAVLLAQKVAKYTRWISKTQLIRR